MHLTTFEKEIPKAILQRGKDYFSEGAVADLQVMDNGQCFAIVTGNDDYEVDIRLGRDGEILEYSCNCPFEGDICKHIAAVLYRLKEETLSKKPSGKTKEQDPWKNIISVIPEEEFRQFVKEYAAKNRDLRNALMIRFSGYDTRNNRDKYKQVLDGIFTAAADRHGYIDYYRTSGVMQQVFELLAKADEYLEEGNYNEAFNIAAAVAPGCINAIQYMDDSDGDCGGAINNSFEIVSKILQSGTNPSLKNETFDWLLGEAGNPDYNDYGCADELYPLMVEAVDSPERGARLLAFLDDQLKKTALKEGWSKEYGTKKFLQLKMEVLIKTGREEKAAEIIGDNMQIHDFRKIVVDKHLKEKNFDEGIRLIREGINIAARENYPGVVTDWKEMLLDIYKKQNNVKEWRAIARDLYYSGRYDMKYYREYKFTFGRDEWPAELEKIINAHNKDKKKDFYTFQTVPYNLAAIYIEEKMWGELFGLLQRNADIHTLNQYSRYLVKDFATDLIPLYKNAIEVASEKASDRKGYHEIASYILKMSAIPGGKGPARLFANQLTEKFNKRPAMKDELGKVVMQLQT